MRGEKLKTIANTDIMVFFESEDATPYINNAHNRLQIIQSVMNLFFIGPQPSVPSPKRRGEVIYTISF